MHWHALEGDTETEKGVVGKHIYLSQSELIVRPKI
jgi:hypothetical protein